MVQAKVTDTTHVLRSVKNTERVYKNSTALKVQEIEGEKPGDFGLIYPYVKGENYRKSFQETGDATSSIWSCGQSIGLIKDVPTCKELLETLVAQTEEIIKTR